ncbi:hypothetical protein FGB62_267g05 [Gracilaria domingensis]|nr:hypothetical protein FGB62_267g05 [Gracilaria domingensis]
MRLGLPSVRGGGIGCFESRVMERRSVLSGKAPMFVVVVAPEKRVDGGVPSAPEYPLALAFSDVGIPRWRDMQIVQPCWALDIWCHCGGGHDSSFRQVQHVQWWLGIVERRHSAGIWFSEQQRKSLAWSTFDSYGAGVR